MNEFIFLPIPSIGEFLMCIRSFFNCLYQFHEETKKDQKSRLKTLPMIELIIIGDSGTGIKLGANDVERVIIVTSPMLNSNQFLSPSIHVHDAEKDKTIGINISSASLDTP